MDLEAALQAAERLANSQDAQLGDCLFADPIDRGRWWGFSFEIVGGPPDWSWTIIVNEIGEGMVMYADHGRPAAIVAPQIRRRWWLFGPREDHRPNYTMIAESIAKSLGSD